MAETKKRTVEDADVIKRLRQAFAETQMEHQEFADKLGCSRSYVGNILSGRVQLSGRIMKQLHENNFDIVWILSGNSDKAEIRKLQEKIDTVKELLKEAYKQ